MRNPTNQAFAITTAGCTLAVAIWAIGMRIKGETISRNAKLVCAGIVLLPPTLRLTQIAIGRINRKNQAGDEESILDAEINWDNIGKLPPRIWASIPDEPGHPAYGELIPLVETLFADTPDHRVLEQLGRTVNGVIARPDQDPALSMTIKQLVLLLKTPWVDERIVRGYFEIFAPSQELSSALQLSCSDMEIAVPTLPDSSTIKIVTLKDHFFTYLLPEILELAPEGKERSDLSAYLQKKGEWAQTNGWGRQKKPPAIHLQLERESQEYNQAWALFTNLEKAIQRTTPSRWGGLDHAMQSTRRALLHIVTILDEPDIPDDKKRRVLKELCVKLGACDPTWVEASRRAVEQLKSETEDGESALLRMAKTVREQIATQVAQVDYHKEWHGLNGLRKLLGKDFGLDSADIDGDYYADSCGGFGIWERDKILRTCMSRYTIDTLVNGVHNQLLMETGDLQNFWAVLYASILKDPALKRELELEMTDEDDDEPFEIEHADDFIIDPDPVNRRFTVKNERGNLVFNQAAVKRMLTHIGLINPI